MLVRALPIQLWPYIVVVYVAMAYIVVVYMIMDGPVDVTESLQVRVLPGLCRDMCIGMRMNTWNGHVVEACV